MAPDISIIIPSYNEENRLPGTLDKIIRYIQNHPYSAEIIVVAEKSEDRTVEVAKEFRSLFPNLTILENDQKYGKGYSVKRGMLQAQGEICLFTDADLSTPIEELDRAMEYMQSYDIVIGSRGLKQSNIVVHQPFYREWLGKSFNRILKSMALTDFSDTQCGFKVFKKHVANALFSQSAITGFAFDVEILFLARQFGFAVKEMPVTWVNEENSHVDPVKDSIRMFRDVMRIKLNHMKGTYTIVPPHPQVKRDMIG